MPEKLEIKKGDKVRIAAKGTTREGIVTSAVNYGAKPWDPKDCWYIELDDQYYGAVYWRQDSDGGSVIKL